MYKKTLVLNNPQLLILLYNCGMIFFILSFFVGDIFSFGLVRLRTIRLSARAGAHIECRCSCSRAEDVTITDVRIKTPDRKWLGMWITSCPDAMGWGFWVIFEKKQLVEIWSWTKQVDFWTWTTGCPRVVRFIIIIPFTVYLPPFIYYWFKNNMSTFYLLGHI